MMKFYDERKTLPQQTTRSTTTIEQSPVTQITVDVIFSYAHANIRMQSVEKLSNLHLSMAIDSVGDRTISELALSYSFIYTYDDVWKQQKSRRVNGKPKIL